MKCFAINFKRIVTYLRFKKVHTMKVHIKKPVYITKYFIKVDRAGNSIIKKKHFFWFLSPWLNEIIPIVHIYVYH